MERLTGVVAELQQNKADPELEKLKYRLQILKREVAKEVTVTSPFMKNTITMLTSYFRMAVDVAFPEIGPIPIPVVPTSSRKFGDYQCNLAMGIAGVIILSFYLLLLYLE